MADEAKLHSPIHLTFEANVGCARCIRVLSWRRIGPFVLTSASCRFGVFGASRGFAEHTSQM